MKLFSFTNKKKSKSRRFRRIFTDYQQESINNYGRKQLKLLTDRGLGVQW